MIASTDIGNILYRDLKAQFTLPTYQGGNVKKGEVTEERIVIHPKVQQHQTIMKKSFAEVNFVVPDFDGNANLVRLNELERQAAAFFDYAGEYDGTSYEVSVASTEILEEASLKCHFVNARILIQVLNVK